MVYIILQMIKTTMIMVVAMMIMGGALISTAPVFAKYNNIHDEVKTQDAESDDSAPHHNGTSYPNMTYCSSSMMVRNDDDVTG